MQKQKPLTWQQMAKGKTFDQKQMQKNEQLKINKYLNITGVQAVSQK